MSICPSPSLLFFVTFIYVKTISHSFKGSDLPDLQEEVDSNPIKDVGLRGEVITGEDSKTENDLIRYSNYMSGAGSTFGGTVAAAPKQVKDLTTGTKKYRLNSQDVPKDSEQMLF